MTEPLIVIGISGIARSGKDTVASQLVHSHGFFRLALADSLRGAFADIDGPTWQIRKELDEAGKGFRWPLQILGTECRKWYDDSLAEVWINCLMAKVAFLSGHHHPRRRQFCVPDVRFPHEERRLRKLTTSLGGKFYSWRVDRPGAGLTGGAAKHASESLVNEVATNVVLLNDSSILTLSLRVRDALEDINRAGKVA